MSYIHLIQLFSYSVKTSHTLKNIQPPIEPNESGEEDERIATVRTKRNPVVYQFYKPTKEFNPVFEKEEDAKVVLNELKFGFERPRLTREGLKEFYKCRLASDCKKKM